MECRQFCHLTKLRRRNKTTGYPPPAALISAASVVYHPRMNAFSLTAASRTPRNPRGAAPGRIGGGTFRPARIAAAVVGALAASLFLASPLPSHADIYRWEDAQGTVHFTDDVASIPELYRKHSTVVIHGAPTGASRPDESARTPEPAVRPPERTRPGPTPADQAALEAERERQDLVSQVEQLKAKIAAKEEHIRMVDAKRSLATNPLRNRFVDPADLDLYKKYKAELPGDREQLKKLEALLDSLKK